MNQLSHTAEPIFVVPCLNEIRHIKGVLQLLRHTQARLGGTIVVVDGGSHDGTRQFVEREAAVHNTLFLLDNPDTVQSAGVNLAVEHYGNRATHLFRIDAHCAYPEDYCDVLLDEMDRTGAASVVVSMHARGERLLQRVVAATQNAPLGNGGARHRMKTEGAFVEHGHHALMNIDAFRAVGGYDAEFTHNEDAELDQRLTAAGYKIWLTSATRATYFPRDGCRPLARQYFKYGAGRAQNVLKHHTRPGSRQAKVIAILPIVLVSGLAPLSAAFLLPLLAWCSLCLAMGTSLALRAKDPALLLAGPLAMVMHLSWSAGFWTNVFLLPSRSLVRPA